MLAEPSSIRRPPLAVMSVFEIFEPSRVFCQSRWKVFPGASLELFSAPGGLQERFWRALGAEVARRRRPRRSRRPPGSIFGDMLAPKTLLLFFRASVAWCFLLAFGQFFVRRSFCLKDVRAPRANGAHAGYIVKTNGFKHIFKLCFRAGECRGEQNTHRSGKKTHAKTASRKQTFWCRFCLFVVPAGPTAKKLPK